MAKPATLTDLFTPLHSIETCMQKDSEIRKTNVEKINNSILGCASTLNDAGLLIAETIEEASDKIIDSLSDLDNIFKSVEDKSSTNSSELSTAKLEAISTGVDALVGIAQNIQALVEKIESNRPTPQPTPEVKEVKGDKDSKLKNLKDLAAAAKEFKDVSLKDAILIKPKVKLVLGAVDVIQKYTGKIDKDSIKDVGEALGAIAKGILEFNKNMALSAVLAPLALIGTIFTIPVIWAASKLFGMVGDKKFSVDAKQAAENLALMSLSLVTFSLSLLATTMIAKYLLMGTGGKIDTDNLIGVVGSIAIFGLMLGAMSLFALVGSKMMSMDTKKGAETILLMNASIITFSLSLLVSYKITEYLTKDIKENGADNAFMTLGVFALMLGTLALFSAISKGMGPVKQAAIGVMLMSASFVVFAASMLISAKIVEKIVDSDFDQSTILTSVKLFAVMIGSAVVFGIIGKFGAKIKQGSVGVMLMSLGIILFSVGMLVYNKAVQGVTLGEMMTLPLMLGVLGIEFGLIGLASEFILPGAAAVAAMSGALVVFGLGMAAFMPNFENTRLSNDELLSLFKTMGILGLEFAAVGLISAPIVAGSVAVAALSGGLVIFGEAMSVFMPNFVNIGMTNDQLFSLFKVIGVLGGEFAALGLLTIPIAAGAAAVAAMGGAMYALGEAFEGDRIANIQSTDVDGFVETLLKLNTVFCTVGGANIKSNNGPLKKLFKGVAAGLTPSDVNRGIRSARNMGKALTDIGQGLLDFQNSIGEKVNDEQFITDLSNSISTVITTIGGAFSTIGQLDQDKQPAKKQTKLGALFDDIITTTFGKKTDVERGIESVKDLGQTIANIAEGLKTFKDIVPNVDSAGWVGQVGTNIALMLDALVVPLTKFGTKDTSYDISATADGVVGINKGFGALKAAFSGTLNYSKHEVDIASAIEHIGEIGTLVKGLAEGAKIMADPKMRKDLGTAGTVDNDFKVSDDATGMIGNIQRLVCSQISVFMNLGKKIQEVGIYDDIQDELVTQKGLFGTESTTAVSVNKGKKSYLGLAVDSAAGIGKIIMDLADGYERMNKNFPSDKVMVSGTARVTKAIAAIMQAWCTIGLSLTSDGSQKQFELIPSSMGMPELTKEFGNIGNLRRLVYWPNNENPYTKATDLIKSSSSAMAAASASLDGIKSANGREFGGFVSAMAEGMNTLANTSPEIQHATDFIDTLRTAKKESVFDNIGSNTEKIAAAINSINSDIMTPYAEMIAAIGTLSEHADKHKEVLNNLRETIEEILEKINEYSGNESSGKVESSTSGNPVKLYKEIKQERKPVASPPQKVNVTIDASFVEAISKLTRAINEKPIFNQ